MVIVLKTTAEALIRLLTLLLQILVQQLEKQEVLAEIHQQGATLEALREEVSVQKKGPEKKVQAQAMVTPTSVASGSSTPLTRPQNPTVVQRKSRAPSIVSQAPSWQEIEAEEETFIIQKTALTQSRAPVPGNLTLSE
jgi:hypothetical protein